MKSRGRCETDFVRASAAPKERIPCTHACCDADAKRNPLQVPGARRGVALASTKHGPVARSLCRKCVARKRVAQGLAPRTCPHGAALADAAYTSCESRRTGVVTAERWNSPWKWLATLFARKCPQQKTSRTCLPRGPAAAPLTASRGPCVAVVAASVLHSGARLGDLNGQGLQ